MVHSTDIMVFFADALILLSGLRVQYEGHGERYAIGARGGASGLGHLGWGVWAGASGLGRLGWVPYGFVSIFKIYC